ncbi:alpha/beta hydrolase [Nordella sp. HKS 07]|uniref:alpha/beta hydrolase n=1 Tax=Nordella sp. HKS 07 TaxID=2712222 RepID=UPI0019D29E11|nr:dienelactone hydrolase family protein [Nordella sp. HKS 07]
MSLALPLRMPSRSSFSFMAAMPMDRPSCRLPSVLPWTECVSSLPTPILVAGIRARSWPPLITNEPYLTRSLDRLGSIYRSVGKLGFGPEKIVLAGFSQGACLSLEYAARHPRYYGGILGFSGGLIGPDPMLRDDRGSFEGTRVFLGCSEKDPFIPAKRVLDTAEHLDKYGAAVTTRLYPGSDHIINEDQITNARAILTLDAVA